MYCIVVDVILFLHSLLYMQILLNDIYLSQFFFCLMLWLDTEYRKAREFVRTKC